MKPIKPFMIEVGNDYVQFTLHASYRLVEWDGDKFPTREAAERLIELYEIPGAKVIEIKDETRTIIRRG